jgi:hypothetical protein
MLFNVVLLSIGAQALKMYSDWWLGSLIKVPFQMDDYTALNTYIRMTTVFGLLLALAGTLSPYISVKNSKNIGMKLQPALAYANMSWFDKTGTTKAQLGSAR